MDIADHDQRNHRRRVSAFVHDSCHFIVADPDRGMNVPLSNWCCGEIACRPATTPDFPADEAPDPES